MLQAANFLAISFIANSTTLDKLDASASSVIFSGGTRATLTNAALRGDGRLDANGYGQRMLLCMANVSLFGGFVDVSVSEIDFANVTMREFHGQLGVERGGRLADCAFDARDRRRDEPQPPILVVADGQTVQQEEAAFDVSNVTLLQNVSCANGQVAPLDGLLSCRVCDDQQFAPDSRTCGYCAPGEEPELSVHAHCVPCATSDYSPKGARCVACPQDEAPVNGATACAPSPPPCPGYRFSSSARCPFLDSQNATLYLGAAAALFLIGGSIVYALNRSRRRRRSRYERLVNVEK